MRNALPQCARLLALLLFAAGCSPKIASRTHARVPVRISVQCPPNQIRLSVEPSQASFHHDTQTDIDWSLDGNADVANVTLSPDAPGTWPFDGTPPFTVPRGGAYRGVGKSNQGLGHHRYTVTVTCNGTTAIFDPDIWVD